MTKIVIGVGSNIAPEKNIALVIHKIKIEFGSVIISPVYQTSAVGFCGDDFLNLVVIVNSELSPSDIVTALWAIEKSMGHERNGQKKYSSRIIDLDLLLYGNEQYDDGELVLPRPKMTEYAYILKPLQDVAGSTVDIISGTSYQDLWKKFSNTKQSLARKDFDFD